MSAGQRNPRLESGADDYVHKSEDAEILLPRVRALVRKTREHPSALNLQESGFRPARIVAIGDGPTGEFVRAALRSEGYEVENAISGAEGIQKLPAGSFDCALVDGQGTIFPNQSDLPMRSGFFTESRKARVCWLHERAEAGSDCFRRGVSSATRQIARRSGGEAGPAKPEVFGLPASESNVVTWRLIVFAVISAAIPAVALLGWTLNAPSLESGIPGVTRMNPITALCLLAINAGWILRRRKNYAILGKTLALAAACCALWRLSEYCFSSGSDLDFVLFHQQILDQAFPNKIAPNTAIALLVLGLSVGMHSYSGKWLQFSSWLALSSGTFKDANQRLSATMERLVLQARELTIAQELFED